MTSKFTVAIVGGGVAGLTLAMALCRLNNNKDVKIDIYEGAHAFTEIGAGVTFWKRPWDVLKKLGLEEDLLKITDVISDEPRPALSFRKADQAKGINFYDAVIPMGTAAFHRAELLQCLVDNITDARVTVHFAKRLVTYSEIPDDETPTITLKFKDGTTGLCHVLLGADGVHSPVRHTMLELAAQKLEKDESEKEAAASLRRKADAVWSGSTVYRTVIDSKKLRELNPNHIALTKMQTYIGRGKSAASYPISQGRLINVAAIQLYREKAGTKHEGAFVTENVKEDLFKLYEGWEDEVKQLMQCANNVSQWMILKTDQLPICTNGNVAILGDAAHAMTPFQGSGAGQAVEDAYMLGLLLGHPSVTLDKVPIALAIYQQIRLPFANRIQRLSDLAGWVTSFQDPSSAEFAKPGSNASKECTGDDVGRLWNIWHEVIINNWKWAWTTSAEEENGKALELLEERLGLRGDKHAVKQ